MLRRETVVDGDGDAPRGVREQPAEGVVGVDVPDDPATAVKVDEPGMGPLPGRPVETQRDFARGAGDDAILRASNVLGLTLQRQKLGHQRARLVQRQLVDRRRPRLRTLIE